MLRLVSGAHVIGFNRSSFSRDGQEVFGYNVYFAYPLSADDASGDAAGSLWLSKQTFDRLYIEIGSKLDVARVRVGDRTKFDLVG